MADVEAAASATDDGGDAPAPAPAPRPPLKRSPRAAAFVNITEGDNQRSNKEKDPSFLFNLAVTRRRPVCFCLFLTNLSFIVLTVALGLAGLNPINTNNIGEVGLILPDETYQRRENGYHTAKNEADYAIAGGKCPRQDVADPITFRMMRDEFESESKGNAFTQAGLSELRGRENQVLNKNGWSARCNTVYKTPYLEGCEVAADVQTPVAGGGSGTYSATTSDGCMRPYSPVYLFEKYGDPNFEDIPGTVNLIKTTSETDYQSLLDMLHKDFTLSNMRSKYLTSTIYAGTPRHEVSRYVNNATLQLIEAGQRISYYSDKYKERERDHLSGWIKRNLQDRFERNFRNRNYPTAFDFIQYDPVEDQVTIDLGLIAVSIFLVWSYMALYTGSLFIACFGMLQIFTSFAGANLLYRYAWPTQDGLGYNYFTLFCALALFIIMGIGADDIFVYWDTWTASKTVPYKTEAHRLKHAWSHAAGAMAVTSMTTILSFLSNLASPFIGVVTFGVFAALLVFVNYCAVTTFFPALVLVYDSHVAQCLPCLSRTGASAKAGLRRCWARLRRKDPDAVRGELFEKSGEAEAPFFQAKFAPFIFRWKRVIIFLLVSLWVVGVAFAAMLPVTAFKAYELLPAETNFYQYNYIGEKWTPKSASPLNVHVTFGLNHKRPLDWRGKYENFRARDSGKPRWDAAFTMDSAAAQQQFIRTADEFVQNPRSGAKIGREFGINPQLATTTTGTLLNTPGGGEDAAFQSAYGVQSLMLALRQWENVSTVVDAATGSYVSPNSTGRSCFPCFSAFDILPPPSTLTQPELYDMSTGLVPPLQLNGLADLRDGCSCVGFFPLPDLVCPFETSTVADGTRYKCTEPDRNMARELGSFFTPETGPDLAWWDSYIFFLGLDNGDFDRTAFYDIQVQTSLRGTESDFELGLRMMKKWDDWMDDYNGRGKNVNRVMVYVPNSPGWVVSSLLKDSGIENMLISLFLAWLVLTYSTGNWITSTLATCTIGMIATIVLGFLTVSGWGLGVLESILIVIVIGFSVDYTVHLADSYMQSRAIDREGKVTDALTHTGMSVLSGAISTILASIPMLFTQIIFFFKFGVFILLTIVLSLIFSLFFFASVLAEIGPIGKRGQVSLLYRDCVNRAKEELDEMDEAQRLVDEQSVRKEGSVKRSWSRASVDDAPAGESSPAPVDL